MNVAAYVAYAFEGRQPGILLQHDRDMLMPWNRLVGLLLLILLSPLLLAIGFLIWWHDGAPVLFAHYRVGCDGKLFRCIKFRTMVRDSERVLDEVLRGDPAARAEWEHSQKLNDDPRITPIGRFLRRTSLDELPQLVNVVRGEMNLVGPRPITVAELARYGRIRWHYLSVRPGITGLWQVSGRNNISYEERVALDRRYVEQRSFLVDLGILLRTFHTVVAGEGAW
ncbi:MAG TPA: sugar transferase [Burkholderiales bacterium]|nr:sugar transferase [Burkholderiales bacterium]